MANIYIENHYAEFVKKPNVIKLLVARDGDLKQRVKEHILTGVSMKSIRQPHLILLTVLFQRPSEFSSTMGKEPLQLKKTS
eukprot:12094344-Karenia_brevis.AAC.1